MESWLEITPNGEMINNVIVGDKIEPTDRLLLSGVEALGTVFYDDLYGQVIIGNMIWDFDTGIDSINGDILELIFKRA